MKKIVLAFLGIAALITVSLYAHYNYKYHYSPKKAVDVDGILNYQMPYVIERCKKDHGYDDEDMAIIEREFKRYLVLVAEKKQKGEGTGMFSKHVDNLWHTFILFTREYTEFGNKYVGRYIHHAPEVVSFENRTPEQRAQSRKDFQAFVKNYEETFKEEIHSIWFLDMCEA
jgi:hypothetical protein